MTRLKRYPGNPILAPTPLRAWEALNVFNAGMIYHEATFTTRRTGRSA